MLKSLLGRFSQTNSAENSSRQETCLTCKTVLGRPEEGVSRCTQCKALWVSPNRFEDLLLAPQAQVQHLLSAPSHGEHTHQPSSVARPCPKCARPMTNYFYEKLWLDACDEGHGIWLDPGELDLLRQTENSSPQGGERMLDLFRNSDRVAILELSTDGVRLATDQQQLATATMDDIPMVTGLPILEVVTVTSARYQALVEAEPVVPAPQVDPLESALDALIEELVLEPVNFLDWLQQLLPGRRSKESQCFEVVCLRLFSALMVCGSLSLPQEKFTSSLERKLFQLQGQGRLKHLREGIDEVNLDHPLLPAEIRRRAEDPGMLWAFWGRLVLLHNIYAGEFEGATPETFLLLSIVGMLYASQVGPLQPLIDLDVVKERLGQEMTWATKHSLNRLAPHRP